MGRGGRGRNETSAAVYQECWQQSVVKVEICWVSLQNPDSGDKLRTTVSGPQQSSFTAFRVNLLGEMVRAKALRRII